jgi:uncharacterized repeat protein (TIGR01451 family)
MSMTSTDRHHRIVRRIAASLIANAILVVPAWATVLRIEGDPAVSASIDAGDVTTFEVINAGLGQFDAVRLFASTGVMLDCDWRTASGRPFAPKSSLAAGDRVGCIGHAVDGLRGGVNVVVTALGSDGMIQRREASFMTLGGITPPQGVIVLAAGSTHADIDADGLLDAGEIIHYDYTVINAGTQTISGIAVLDIEGAVTCPLTALAIDTHMSCTRAYEITVDEDTAGLVDNHVLVTADPTNGPPLIAASVVVNLDLASDAGISAFKSPLLLNDADGSSFASEGDVIGYTFVVKNTRAQLLSAVDLVEPDPTLIDGPITCAGKTLDGQLFSGLGTGVLGPQDVVLCSAQHTITGADASTGIAWNLVEAYGQPIIGAQVFATGASVVVIPTPGAVTIGKALIGESGGLPGVAEPGETLTYAITLTNSGGNNVPSFGVTDVLDVNTIFVSADNGGTHADGVVKWSDVPVPANSIVGLVVEVMVVGALPPGELRIVNLAYETGTIPPPCPPANDACVVLPTVGSLVIDKAVADSDGNGLADPGENLTYTITLTNDGGSVVNDIDVTDLLDPNTVFVSADNGGQHAAGIVTWTGLSIPAEGALMLTAVVTVANSLPLDATTIANRAFESGLSPPDCDSTPQPDACATIPAAGTAQIGIVKSVDSSTTVPGGTVVYTISVGNLGNSTVHDLTVNDPIPAGIASFVWTCAASRGADCPTANGSGAIAQKVPVFPAGGELVYSVTAQLSGSPPGSVLNVVTVTPDELVTCIPDNTVSPCSADVDVVIAGTPPGPTLPVPADGRWALVLLSALMLGLALLRGRCPAR